MRKFAAIAAVVLMVPLLTLDAQVVELVAPKKPIEPVLPFKVPDPLIKIAESWASFSPDKIEAAAWRGGCWGVMVTLAAYTALGMCGYMLVQNAKRNP